MHISRFQLNDYKSIHKSDEIELTPGVNLIVGKNNAGKTALLEGLSLRFSENLYRSSKVRRKVDPANRPTSWAEISITITRNELWSILRDTPGRFGVPLPEREEYLSIEGKPEVEHIAYFLNRVFESEEFTLRASYKSDASSSKFVASQTPCFGTYKARGGPNNLMLVFCEIDGEDSLVVNEPQSGSAGMDFGLQVMEALQQRIYSFTAERFALSKCKIGLSNQLEPDATNLAEVLGNLKDRSPKKFRQLNQYLQQVFPNIYEVSVRPCVGDAQHREIIVYEQDSDDERDAISLADSGTGIGQVVAMLYVLVASKHPKTILIDEPQSFLHPGAVRKLFQVFALYSQHQYVVATHLTTVIAASKASAILLVRKEPGAQTTFTPIDVNETKALSTVLDEVGARLSDVFGADSILWVEGNTERDCFPMILDTLTEQKQWGTELVPVISPDELVGSDADRIVRIYERLSRGKGLLPPAVGFVFDRECRTTKTRDDLERRLGGRVRFLPRRMFENYFLKPKAIAAVVNEITGFSEAIVTESEIEVWLQQKIEERQYYCQHQGAGAPNIAVWRTEVDGARILGDLFAHFSNQRVGYRKVEHGTKLTEWLLTNDPDDFKEIASLLQTLLKI